MKCKDTFLGNGDKVADCDFCVILHTLKKG